jgi:hypothetical protein
VACSCRSLPAPKADPRTFVFKYVNGMVEMSDGRNSSWSMTEVKITSPFEHEKDSNQGVFGSGSVEE